MNINATERDEARGPASLGPGRRRLSVYYSAGRSYSRVTGLESIKEGKEPLGGSVPASRHLGR